MATLGSIRFTGAEGVENPEDYKPVRTTDGAVGYDVFACRVLDRETRRPKGTLPAYIMPGELLLIGVGVILAVPQGFEIQVRPRSGLATRHNIELSNSPGTIDPDFRGEAGVLLRNRGSEPFQVEPKMRIAQFIFSEVALPDLVFVASADQLPPTRRADGGFGSTGYMGRGPGTADYDATLARIDRYMMRIAIATSELSNCVRGCQRGPDGSFPRDSEGRLIGQTRRYGCVIARGDRVIATGFNAQYPGAKLCAEVGCLRDERGIPSGTQVEICRAIHAEMSAILTCANENVAAKGATLYVNAEPCLACAHNLAGLGIEALVVLDGGYSSDQGLKVIQEASIKIRRIKLPEAA